CGGVWSSERADALGQLADGVTQRQRAGAGEGTWIHRRREVFFLFDQAFPLLAGGATGRGGRRVGQTGRLGLLLVVRKLFVIRKRFDVSRGLAGCAALGLLGGADRSRILGGRGRGCFRL